jgi:L-asparaginase II
MSTELAGIPAVDVTRGERIESTHDVAACACDDRGRVLLEHGTIDVPVFLRSAAKPFIAAAAVRAGVVERFGLTQREIALMCASHMGEPDHVAAAASILAKIGATESDLRCGGVPSALYNNCSGKHAGILALATLRGQSLDGYLDATHPVQQEILAFCELAFNDRFTPGRLGIDGCGIPVFATSLRNAAHGFARFATLRDFDPGAASALKIVRDAMIAYPWYVSGTNRFDTDLMTVAGTSICAKGGAEGVHATALLDTGTGLVMKVIDGAQRAVAPATIALLYGLGTLGLDDVHALGAHTHTPIVNVAGTTVGDIHARSPMSP